MTSRLYSGRRSLIVQAIADKLNEIDGTGDFVSNLYEQVITRLVFPDEISSWPTVCVTGGVERREYQGGGYRDRFLTVTARIYVKEEDPTVALDKILEDIESILEGNSRLSYVDRQGVNQQIKDIKVQNILTDEGTLEPLAVGEMVLEVHY